MPHTLAIDQGNSFGSAPEVLRELAAVHEQCPVRATAFFARLSNRGPVSRVQQVRLNTPIVRPATGCLIGTAAHERRSRFST